jgi:hypothetical protein
MFLLGRSLSPSFSDAAIRSYSSMRIMGEPPALLAVHPIQNRFMCTQRTLCTLLHHFCTDDGFGRNLDVFPMGTDALVELSRINFN